MKKHIALFSIVAAALLAMPVLSQAADPVKPKEAPAVTVKAAPAKKQALPFRGKVSAVDAAAMTVTVGQMVLNVSSETKITKDGKPATVSELAVGDQATGSYKKDDAGKMSATIIRVGAKGEKAAPAVKAAPKKTN